MYPPGILCEVFSCGIEQLETLPIKDDVIEMNGICFTKTELCERIVTEMTAESELPEELEKKLLARVESCIE